MSYILPAHEQHYPDHLLPTRLQEYVRDGQPPTMNRGAAVRVTGQQVLDAIIAAQERTGLGEIDPRYFVATCFHEAGCTNEWDTEIASPSCIPGFVSVGAYQIGEEEAHSYGFALADMLDFEKATECMVKLAQTNLNKLKQYIKMFTAKPNILDYTDPNGNLWKDGALRAYLAIVHNKGGGYARATIQNYGLNWPEYKIRNAKTDALVAHGYGEDCVTGGPYYPDIVPPLPEPGHRTLQLENPYMTGEDVKEVQRHLNITPDGVYGPQTENAVMAFQKSKGIPADGICGPGTWAALLAP